MKCPICEEPIEAKGASIIEDDFSMTFVHAACREEWKIKGISAQKQNLIEGTFTILNDMSMTGPDDEEWMLTAGTILTGSYEPCVRGDLIYLLTNEHGDMEIDFDDVRIEPIEESLYLEMQQARRAHELAISEYRDAISKLEGANS